MHASFKIVKFPMQRCLVGWQEYALSIYFQIFLYTVTECHTGGIQLFLCISQYFFFHFLCSKLMNNKLVTFPSRTLRNQNPIELWVCFFFCFLKENRRSEKNCREQLDSNCGLLWLNSRQTVVEVIIAHWKFERSVFF